MKKSLTNEEKIYQLAVIVEYSDDAIYSKTLEGIVTSWNRGAQNMYGYSEAEMVGESITKIIPEEKIAEYADFMDKVKNGVPTNDLETVRVAKGGKRINVSLRISPIKNTRGMIIGVSAIARDISDQKKMEEKKNDFIRMAGHELKTPITTVMLVGQLAEKRAKKKSLTGIAENIATMNDQVRRMAKIVDDMLDLSKIESGKLELVKESVDIDDLVKSTVADLKHFGDGKNIYIEGRVGERLFIDKFRIIRVLTNLIVNAIKYSGESKTIKVIMEKKNGLATICIQDYGMGIGKDDQKRIFMRDYRTDRAIKSAGGLGLGLFIAKEIIKSHKGRIWVESEINKGSKFFISLPIRSDQ